MPSTDIDTPDTAQHTNSRAWPITGSARLSLFSCPTALLFHRLFDAGMKGKVLPLYPDELHGDSHTV